MSSENLILVSESFENFQKKLEELQVNPNDIPALLKLMAKGSQVFIMADFAKFIGHKGSSTTKISQKWQKAGLIKIYYPMQNGFNSYMKQLGRKPDRRSVVVRFNSESKAVHKFISIVQEHTAALATLRQVQTV